MISSIVSFGRRALVMCSIFFAASSFAGQASYQSIFVFGDSLSDTGNDLLATSSKGITPAIPPSKSPHETYWRGRFSNGPVAAEYLWGLIGHKGASELIPSLALSSVPKQAGVSFAFGGSASGVSTVTPLGFPAPGLLGQVNLFAEMLAGKTPMGNSLFVVWAGSNDYLQSLTGSPNPVVGNVVQSIRQLHALGAKDFLVPNLPDMGLAPFVKVKGLSGLFTQLTIAHNTLLATSLASLQRELPGARIVSVDVYATGANLMSSGQVVTDLPAAEHLAPGKGAADCLFRNPATCVDVPMPAFLPPFLFWDVLHPTTQVHAIIGTAMYRALLDQK
ncbi:SGNH/GDSL hydrolase family protein [Pseudorhodoferax sp. Leaf267]|uniref:SGNH/GDSL hydrolase family protein n=1 Tax=Pseudorhodoferax sp. Leaf267 TaxID=1736316 RepID=UPI00138EDC3B|nr:SGNH/GDSL hydrolase family protein [Pseudorhodoferax sp. Leaf267]